MLKLITLKLNETTFLICDQQDIKTVIHTKTTKNEGIFNVIAGLCDQNNGDTIYTPLGLICEILDLREIDSTYDREPYPIAIETSIIPLAQHKNFIKSADQDNNLKTVKNKNDRILLAIELCYQYAGGIPINIESVQSSETSKAHSELRTQKHATLGYEIKVRHFRTYEDAEQYIKDVYQHNAIAIFSLIGFYLDKPINRIGWTGWNILEHQVQNKELRMF